MTENLRYELKNNVPLTPQNSDVVSSWTPPENTKNYTGVREFNFDKPFSYYGGAVAQNGVYYSYLSVTAGTSVGKNSDGDEATGSVCPKGWRLPKVGKQTKTDSNDFYKLAKNYRGSATWNDSNGEFIGAHEMVSGVPNYLYSGFLENYFYKGVGPDVTEGEETRINEEMFGSGGVWWSSTVGDADSVYVMKLLKSGNSISVGKKVEHKVARRDISGDPDDPESSYQIYKIARNHTVRCVAR